MMACSRSCFYGPRAAILAATIGTLLCIGFACTFHYFPSIFHSMVLSLMCLSPTSMMFSAWAEPPLDLTANIYLFNYTNSDDFLANWKQGVKPIVTEAGPYTYVAHLKKVFFDWSEPPYVSYRMLHYYYFHRELSVGDEDDEVIIPNVLALAISGMQPSTDSMALLQKYMMDSESSAEPPFIKVRAGDFIAYGYQDKALEAAQEALNIEIIPEGRIGILYGKNASDDKKYKVDTGANIPENAFHIVEWNEMASTESIWGDKYCGMINGSDGTVFTAGMDRQDNAYMFLSFLRRSFYANYTNDVTYKGIDAYNYRWPLQTYADYNMNPDNHCYTDGDPNKTYASGINYLGKLVHGAPVYASNPHFLDGDFQLVEAIDGLHPNDDLHCTHFYIVPDLGAPIYINLRLQLNILMQPSPGIIATKDWPTIMLPIVWAQGVGGLTDAMADDLAKYYYGGLKLIYGLLITFLIICGLVGLAGITCSYTLMFKYQKSTVICDVIEDMTHGHGSTQDQPEQHDSKDKFL